METISRRKFLWLALASCASGSMFAAEINGIDYLSIPELAKLCGMRYRTLQRQKSFRVYSKYTSMEFFVNKRNMLLNNKVLWLGNPVALKGDMLYSSKRDYLKTIAPIIFPQNGGNPPACSHIVIDAGHGGKDNGAQNDKLKLKEKNITLDISLRLGKILKSRGYKVSYTRTKDVFIELADRPKIANSARGNLFLSVHCNAAASGVSGIETFALTPRYMPSTSSAGMPSVDKKHLAGNDFDHWNQLISWHIQQSLLSASGSPDRGVKRARWKVLQGIKMPASLIECGFLSNPSEGSRLGSAEYRGKIAVALADSVDTYKRTLSRIKPKKK